MICSQSNVGSPRESGLSASNMQLDAAYRRAPSEKKKPRVSTNLSNKFVGNSYKARSCSCFTSGGRGSSIDSHRRSAHEFRDNTFDGRESTALDLR